ncbi:PepSY domain-containing protein [Ralstonia pseudosolanacearum]|uniref:PepSY domain-containing protein n=1 Tax=Ralstonia pseudosolanacearum TaxID=1310165 RepID=UPI00035B59B4|nr:PepSY domain-containing protein [Ralstonia pseudosolanacearum]ESS47082.1 signal peptide protein [Ralstonia solanacearum SD54]MCK4146223.1 PepSY domain-containing protein [Ralstonia pseudosolanacearum]BCL86050.1 hypothetical protein MAFF211471_11330 [Ralstonia solanacearum]BCM98599.1 hypothetical protein RPSA_11360 [Ralstonia solanacearum]
MLKLTLAVLATACSASAFASANCTAHPKNEWMPEAEAQAQAKIKAQGYTIKKFKVDGHCYEIYGTNQDGKKVEIYYDTKTLDVVKSEIEK